MDSLKDFTTLFPDKIRKRLHDDGVQFSELRHASETPENLIEAIYRYWRGGKARIERNGSGIQAVAKTVPYSNSACLIPEDHIYIDNSTLQNMWKVATWNVNSIRTRLPLLLEWLKEQNPDVVCLQETKVEDAQFPAWELRHAGYESVFYGQKSYNGVAILSKNAIKDVQLGFQNCYDQDNARLIAATISGVRVINVYIPQGQTTESDKFKYKLTFFEELIQEILAGNFTDRPLAIMGDFNIAPKAVDVSNPETMRNKVSFHPKEHALLTKLTNIGLSDLFRKFDPRSGQYSWWDFRTQGFERGEGMRIDFILANTVLTSSCQACIIDTEARNQDRPSDHAPVIGEFKL